MNTVQIGKRTIIPPQKWNELTPKQLRCLAPDIVELYETIKDKPAPAILQQIRDRIEVKAVQHFLNLSLWMLFFKLTTQQIHGLRPITGWLFKNLELTDTIIESFWHRCRKYYGPADGLGNLTLDEFSFAATFFTKYQVTQNDDHINQLVAVLYRAKDPDYSPGTPAAKGDIREPFNKYTYNDRSVRLRKLDRGTRQAILLQFWGAYNKLAKDHPNVFRTKKKIGRSFGWGGFIAELAGDKFGTVKETEKANVIMVFGWCEMNARKIKEQKNKNRKP